MQYLRIESHRQIYKVRRKNTVTTKLDAPYTLLSIRGQASRVPVSSEVKGAELQAPNMHLQNLMQQEPSTATGTTNSATALAQKVPIENDQEQEAQPLVGQGYTQAEQVLAKIQTRTKEERGKLTRKEQRTKMLEASKTQSEKAKEYNQEVAKEAKILAGRQPGLSEKVARKIARKAVKKAANEGGQGKYKMQEFANRTTEAEKGKGKAFMIYQKNRNKGKTDDGSAFAVRFTSQGQEPLPKFSLQPEAQNAPPVTIKRHFSVGSGDFSQKHGAPQQQKIYGKSESMSESRSVRDDFKYGNKPPRTESDDSVPIIMEESDGKNPGIAHIGKEGNVFMVRRHPTMNPFERLQAIRHVGEITSRDQAMVGLHGQYHPLFDNQPEDLQKS